MWYIVGDSSQVPLNTFLLSTYNVLGLCKCKLCPFLTQWSAPVCPACLVLSEPELLSSDRCLLSQESISLMRCLEPLRGLRNAKASQQAWSLVRLYVGVCGSLRGVPQTLSYSTS